jgi:hypothetical protein
MSDDIEDEERDVPVEQVIADAVEVVRDAFIGVLTGDLTKPFRTVVEKSHDYHTNDDYIVDKKEDE